MALSDPDVGLQATSSSLLGKTYVRNTPVRLATEADAGLPSIPRSVQETGLPFPFLTDLLLKILFVSGRCALSRIVTRSCLSGSVLDPILAYLREEQWVEIARRGASEGDVFYQLSESGKARALEKLQRCQYAGPAPVSLEDYTRQIERRSIAKIEIRRPTVHDLFADVVVPDSILDRLGAAMNSGRAMFIYGPAGSGKTYLAERLSRLLGDVVPIPHALLVDSEVIQVFDPLVHQVVDVSIAADSLIEKTRTLDPRWLICQRPVVLTGGELTLAMLDLRFDDNSRFYQAPPHLKANNGIFIVDDLGRQLVAPRDLMNRWIVPLDRHCDYQTLHTGYKFRVPFDVAVVFSTNLKPADLADEAFLRRLGYKIHIGPLVRKDYQRIFESCCAELQIRFDAEVFEYLVHELHETEERPMLACYPRDLLGQIRDLAIYEGSERAMSRENIRYAWDTYFLTGR